MMTLAVALPRAEAVTIQEVKAPAGVEAWLVEDYTVPIVTMNVAFRGGAAQDPEGKTGLANMMSTLLDEGAGDLDSLAFQTRLEDLNVNLSFEAGKDAFYGNLRTLKQNQDAAFELFRLAVNEPRFDAEPIERMRSQILSGLRRAETDPGEIAGKAWAATLFGDHPYGRPTEGTISTVSAVNADDLRDFHGRTIARDNLHVVIVGAIDKETAAKALDTMFGRLPEKAQLTPVPEIQPALGKTVHENLSIPQTTIRFGGQGLKREDPDFIPAYIADHIIGGGTFSSRLYTEIREKRGLAYSVGTGLVPYDHAGASVAAAATRADAARTAIDIMTGEIRRFADQGPTEDELAKAKDYLIGNYALRFDASQKIARQLLGIQLDRLGIDYVDRRNDLIRGVTVEDVKRAAKRIYGAPVSVITVGPSES
jgi:zinc protease